MIVELFKNLFIKAWTSSKPNTCTTLTVCPAIRSVIRSDKTNGPRQ